MVYLLSNIGSYHRESNGENQDVVCQSSNKRYAVISLADGVSTCSRAKQGAEIASEAITNLFLKKADFFLNFDRRQIVEFALSHIRYSLAKQAETDHANICEYSSTVASVLYDRRERKLLYFNLGDSLILAVDQGKCRILSVPANSMDGCCVTTTKDAAMTVQTDVIDAVSFESILICSDGAWAHMFEKNKMKQEVKDLLCVGDFEALAAYLDSQEGYDDYSFVALNTVSKDRRNSA